MLGHLEPIMEWLGLELGNRDGDKKKNSKVGDRGDFWLTPDTHINFAGRS